MTFAGQKLRVSATAFAIVLSGCAQLPFSTVIVAPPVTHAAVAVSARAAEHCAGLDNLGDTEVAALLDIAPLLLGKLRSATGKSNEQICALPEPEINRILLADRNKYRNPDRKTFRAPAKDFIRQWDADDFGRLPNSNQVLAAESARKTLAAGTRRDGRGESAMTQGAGTASTQWSAIGPGNVGGRVRAIVIDPRNANRLFIGAASGGIWLSEDAGQSFRPVVDFIGNLAIGAMAIDPGNPGVMYAATGESFAALPGIGVFKSTDNGNTWSILPATNTDTSVNTGGNDWVYINRIVVNPANPNILLAATYTSLFRSSNAGATWSKVGNFEVLDVQFDPHDSSRALAGTDKGYMYTSRDAGVTWTQSAVLVPPESLKGRGTPKTARAEIAYARSQSNVVYASLDNNGDNSAARGEVWKSVDGGETWNLLSTPGHLSDQGDYDNAIWVDPTNDNHIVVGGLDLYQSTDGGASFNRISTWQLAGPGAPQPHADHHQIVSVPNFSAGNPVVYFGNDGGLYRANNIFNVSSSGTASWQNLNNGLAVTQFYGGAGKRAAGGKIIGGTQDNGTLVYNSGTNWDRFAGGDGGFVAVDPVDDNTLYGEYVYASIHRTMGLQSREYICTGITDALKNTKSANYCGADNVEAANFISPFILDPNNRNRMLVGANSLWVSNNVKGISPAMPVWTAIKAPVAPVATSDKPFINAIAVADTDSNIIWTGHNSSGSTTSQVWKTINGLSSAPVWERVGAGVLPTSTVNRITIDPDNANRVWVSYSGFSLSRIWLTNDGGATWANIHNNLPAITVHDLKRHPQQANWLYAATANGVYTSENGGQSWSTTNDGPASVRVRELFWYDSSTLVAATYGRGMFRTSIGISGPASYQGLWWNAAESGWGMSITQHGNIIFAALYTYDDSGQPTWYVIPNCPIATTSCSGDIYKVTGGTPPGVNWSEAGKVVTKVGTGSLSFLNTSAGVFNFTINNAGGGKAITQQVFATGTTPPTVNYTDLWWNPAENGWGISLTQQFGIIFAAWYTYDAAGKPVWYVAPNCPVTGSACTGALYQVTGGEALTAVWNGTSPATQVGNVTFTFSNASNGTMSYTLNNTTSSRVITRQVF